MKITIINSQRPPGSQTETRQGDWAHLTRLEAGLAVSEGRHTYRGHKSGRTLRVLNKLGPGIADVIVVDVALGPRPVGALFTERIRREMERKGIQFTVVARGRR